MAVRGSISGSGLSRIAWGNDDFESVSAGLWFAKTRPAFKGLKLAKLNEEAISHSNPLNNSLFGLTTPV